MSIPSADTAAPVRPTGSKAVLRYVAGVLILLAGLTLAAKTVRTALRHESVLAVSGIQAFADAAERSRRLHDVVGTFATGNEPGDRMIEVRSDGHVRFYPIGPLQGALQREDTFQLGKHGKFVCLETKSSGVIDALDIDQLSYFDDVYVRVK